MAETNPPAARDGAQCREPLLQEVEEEERPLLVTSHVALEHVRDGSFHLMALTY